MFLHKKEGIALKLKTSLEAKREAQKMFKNLARKEFIDLNDLERFLGIDEAEKALSLFQGKSSQHKISKTLFIQSMVLSHKRYRSICLSLEDTDGISKRINMVVTMFIAAVLVVIGFLLIGICYTHPLFLGFIAFIITFLFGTGKQEMVVAKLNLKYTVFIGMDDKKHHVFPNTLLCTKQITNNSRSGRCSGNVTIERDVV